MSALPSLREHKKARTRRELIEVSQRLFARQGFSETTLEQICAEVEVRPQTLLRYFPSKAHLALAPLYDAFERLRARIEAPERSEQAIAIWRDQVEQQSLRYNRAAGRYMRWIADEPLLRAMSEVLRTRYEDLLAAGLAADLGVARDDFYCVLLAATLVRGNYAMLRRWIQKGARPEELARNQVAVVDFILASFPARSSRAMDPVRDL
jgi:AcrR family transcriptional regulator